MEETKFSRVKVEALLSVVSTKPIEPGKVHKLSFLDHAMGFHTAHVVFYYKSNPFKEGPMSYDLDNLRISLSRLLDQYPNVTGRLTRDPDGSWVVKCNDAGVRMVHANVDATLDEWLRSAGAAEERDLTVWEEMPQDPCFWSPFRIQINNLKCGALAIGLSCTHMEADLTSLTMLMKSWADVHTAKPLTHPPIFHLPSEESDHSSSPIQNNIATSPPPPSPKIMSTVTFKFSGIAIEKYLAQIQNQSPNATPFDLLAALFFSCVSSSHDICICLDLRQGLGQHKPIVPYAYFGNAVHFSSLSLDSEGLMTNGELGRMSDSVHQHVEQLLKRIKAQDLQAYINNNNNTRRMFGPQLTFLNMEHMIDEKGQALMYGIEFEKGERPVHVSYNVGNVEGEGLISVMPSDEGGLGRVVTVCVPEDKIGNLCEDQRILDLKPDLLISGTR